MKYYDYEVTPDGKVFNNKKELKQTQTSRNKRYKIVTLCINGKSCKRYVHRLVAELYIPNPLNLPAVNHKNLNSLDNSVENLEWCTYQQNTIHAYKNGAFKTNICSCGKEYYTNYRNRGLCTKCYQHEREEQIKKDNKEKKIRERIEALTVIPTKPKHLEIIELILQGKTFAEVGKIFGYSKQYIHQITSKYFNKEKEYGRI